MNVHFRHARRLPAICGALAILLIVSMPTVSRAELIDYFAAAMPGWSGTLSLSGVGEPTVSVEFAVFAPGDFNTALGSGDPSDGSQYVYAYQLIKRSG